MSRVFKRPMFRRGGNVGSGIMTGIVDRSMHAKDPFVGGMNQIDAYAQDGFPQQEEKNVVLPNSSQTSNNVEDAFNTDSFKSTASAGTPTSVEEYTAQLQAGAGEYGGMDPLTSYLLTAGPQIAKATSFGDAISRLEKPNAALIASQGKKAQYDRDLKLAATKMGIADKSKFQDRQFQLDTQADNRRFDRLIKTDDREWKSMLIKDERDYLDNVKLGDREWKKYLIGDEKDYQKRLLTDRREYEKLTLGEKQEYDAKLLSDAKGYNDMKDSEKREYEKELIADGRVFELEKITRKEKFEERLYDKSLADSKLKTGDFYATQEYGNDQVKGQYRADYENDRLQVKLIELFGDDYKGLKGADNHGTIQAILKNPKKKHINSVYYDISDGKTKQITKKDGVWGYNTIDLDNYKPEEVTEDKGNKFNTENPSYMYPPKEPDLTGNPPFGTNIEDQG